jgi:O-antigen ligase
MTGVVAMTAQHHLHRRLRGALSRDSATAGGVALLLISVGAVNGGYFPTSWGWVGLALGWAVLVALFLNGGAALSTGGLAFASLLAAYVGWVALSVVWSVNVTQTVLEVERDVVYVVAALAFLLLAARRREPVLAGALIGVTALCTYALTTRLLPDRLGVFDPIAGYRLSEPLGYWNALGVFAAMGALLAVGYVADARSRVLRAFGGASLVVLLPTLQFTFSRGGWASLVLGAVAFFIVEPRRLRLAVAALVAALAPALAVVAGWRSEALTTGGAHLVNATRDGHRLAALLVMLAFLGAALAAAFGHVVHRWEPPRRAAALARAALALAALVGVTAAVVAYGSPTSIARHSWDAFAGPSAATGPNLNERLFSFSGSGRVTQWRVAVEQYEDHPVLGSGAGTYERYWVRNRPVGGKVRDAHNLYLEVLAELGPVGLLALLTALAVPLGVALRARHSRLVAAPAAAYVAYLVHASVDWDWEMLVVTLLALLCGSAVVAAAGTSSQVRVRAVALGFAAVVVVVAFVGLAGNIELSRAGAALRAGDWVSAERHAERAHTWAPWSTAPWRRLGEARLAAGQFAGARDAFLTATHRDRGDWELWFDLARASTGAAQRLALDNAAGLNPLSPEIAEFRRELAQGWVILDEKQS